MNRFIKISMVAAILCSLTVLTPKVHATSDRNWSAGVLLGPGFLDNDIGTKFTGGLMVRDRFVPNFGIGLTITSASLASDSGYNYYTGNYSYSVNLTHVNFDFLYYFTGPLDGLFVGPRLGWAQISTQGKALGRTASFHSDSYFDWGPMVGYDYQLSDLISLGVDISYLTTNENEAGVNQTISTLQALGALKFHW